MTRAQAKEGLARAGFAAAAGICILAVALICVFLFANGVPAISEIGVADFLLGTKWKPGNDIYGIFPMIVGSIYATAGAVIVGVPSGFLCAAFLSRFAGKGVGRFLSNGVELLAGIPSVVYGFFALMVFVPFIRNNLPGKGMSLLAASLILGIMILPTVITVAKSALDAVPKRYYEGALALGGDHERAVFGVVVPAAASGILAGIVLGIGRAIGEAMAVMMVAGNSPNMPDSLFRSVTLLTTAIAKEMSYAGGLQRQALFSIALVLFAFIMLINVVLNVVLKGGNRDE